MSQNPTPAVGQVSADGQLKWDGAQWAPIASGYREPTSWTRPMQLATAAVFVISALLNTAMTFIFVNHDTTLRSILAQDQQYPAGTDIEDVVNAAMLITYVGTVVFGLLYLFIAFGAYRGWRWMFWIALVAFGLGGLGAFINLGALAKPAESAYPFASLVVDELGGIVSLGMFVWMLVGLVQRGPWAMRKPA